ncbi:hypothetical protein GRS48_09865 [Halorubrum sp. JWXQ-INN 858]|uniref:hypothetical protein n=1 Tax=Halorubrum sp. JWXQ-INN 858 TaxID=2690782 RepID=UPI00135A084A|nr:hypothetical protein [Halorubrum sp. JWXQ-INN 858]MWV65123.1 hypothetical protein [Halorubrum sp. JWXQ-INN 858]
MPALQAPSTGTALGLLSIGLLAGMSGVRLVGTPDAPWVGVALVALVTGLLCGPVAWLARDRLPADRRGLLLAGFAGAVLLGFPLALGAALVLEVPVRLAGDVLILGTFVGGVGVVLAEATVVPARLRSGGL